MVFGFSELLDGSRVERLLSETYFSAELDLLGGARILLPPMSHCRVCKSILLKHKAVAFLGV
jgi:hypothetical protein